MFSKMPIELARISQINLDREILRTAIIAELDAINLHEQMAVMTSDKNLKIVLIDVAKEEKTHVGEFETLFLKLDK